MRKYINLQHDVGHKMNADGPDVARGPPVEYPCFIDLKLQSVTFGALAVNKQNCVSLEEEYSCWIYFSLFMSMTNHAGNGLLRSGTYPNQSKIVRI